MKIKFEDKIKRRIRTKFTRVERGSVNDSLSYLPHVYYDEIWDWFERATYWGSFVSITINIFLPLEARIWENIRFELRSYLRNRIGKTRRK